VPGLGQGQGLGPLDYVLLFVACGMATIPISIMVLKIFTGPSWAERLDKALSWSMTGWILGVMIFYAGMVLLERQRPCEMQRTNQITQACKDYFDSLPR
jgi:hypothetical protein